MASRRVKESISYGELTEYEYAVDSIRKSGLTIAKMVKAYEADTYMAVSDGDIFVANVRGEIARMQKALRRIDAMSKKYGRRRSCRIS